MCQYSILGIIIFQVLPPLIIGGVLVTIIIKVFHFSRLNLIWKIISIILALVLTFVLWIWFEELKSMYSLDNGQFFDKIGVWQCDDKMLEGTKFFK